MVLFLIGVGLTLYMIRELVKLWHEPDTVRWVGPVQLDQETVAELESDMVDAEEKPKDPKTKQRPRCPYRQMNCTFEKPVVEPINCCSPLPSDQVKPKLTGAPMESGFELSMAKLVATLPKEVQNAILEEADKMDKMRRQSNALADFVSKIDDKQGPSPPPPSPDPEPGEQKM